MVRARLCLFIVAGALPACVSTGSGPQAQRGDDLSPLRLPTPGASQPREYPGIHNAVAYHDGFVSGSAPEGDVGFDTLAALGVKTIISVDGAAPEVELARARGMRYIHLPIGYHGFDEPRRRQLVRATRDALRCGPVYLHCHHGKHRSAGAAAAIAASLGWLTPAQGVARMHVSGTALDYKGLYACAQSATVLASHEIDRVPAVFPEVWTPGDFVRGMVEIEEVTENLKLIEKAGWSAPGRHPDLVPAAEAGRLADLYRVLSATEYVARRPVAFSMLMRDEQVLAQQLEDAIVLGKPAPDLSAALRRISASCRDCHAQYRD